MRFLVDERTGPAVARWLRGESHDVCSVYDEAPGMSDEDVLDKAHVENRILITNDKDFGEKVYREKLPHRGVVLLRLRDERAVSKIEAIRRLLEGHAHRLPEHFVVVTETLARFGEP